MNCYIIPAVHGAMGFGQKKKTKLVWQCHQFLSGFLVKSHLPRTLHQSRLSANDKGDNEMIAKA